MATNRRPQPAHIKWTKDGWTPAVADSIEKCFRTLFADMGLTDTVARGGTGITSYTAGDILYSPSDGALTTLAIGSEGQILRISSSTIPAWSTFTIPDAFSQGDVLYATSTNVLAGLAKNTSSTRYLSNTGTSNAPAWAQIALTTGVTGVLPIANGGTNNSSAYTAGSVIFSDGTSLTQDNSNLFWNNSSKRLGIGTATTSSTLDIRGATPDIRLEHASAADFASMRFYENGTQKVIIQHVGSTFSDATRQDDLEFFTLASTADAVFYINSAETVRINTSGLKIASGKTLTLTGFTAGRVLFVGSSAEVAQDANLFWDDTNDRLGIGTASPGAGIHIVKTFSTDQAVGMYADIFHDTATGGTVYGGRYDATCSHSSGTMNNTIGLINSARYRGTGTALATSLQGMQCFVCLDDVASPQGTITTATGVALTSIGNFATGTPAVTISQARGLTIGDIGSGNGSNGLTISNSCAMSLAGSQTAASNTAVINISNTTSVPFAPTGTWSIFNASTRNNHIAGPILIGGTTAAGGGTNYISFANGTAVTSTAADTSAIYTADTAAGDSNLFATNEQDYVAQLTGLDIAKTADESVANNTPQNDDHLLVNLPASSRYRFNFYLFATSPATAGLLLQLDGTAGVSSLKANISIYDSTGALVAFGRKTAFNSSTGVDFTGDAYAVIEGVIEVSTAGTFRLEWAQNTTDGSNATVVQENSSLVLRKLNA